MIPEHQMLIKLRCLIYLWISRITIHFRWIESLKEQQLFEIEILLLINLMYALLIKSTLFWNITDSEH